MQQASGNQRHITMPDGNRRDHFLKWIEELSDRQTPSWLGLPNNAEKVIWSINDKTYCLLHIINGLKNYVPYEMLIIIVSGEKCFSFNKKNYSFLYYIYE